MTPRFVGLKDPWLKINASVIKGYLMFWEMG